MDFQPYEITRQPNTSGNSSLAVAGLTLSIIGLVFSFVPFFGTICPSIAVTLALLSRGGNMKTQGKNRVALIVGVLGILIAIATTVAVIYYLFANFDQNAFMEYFNNTVSNSGTYM